ncbi:hypothetical protein PENSPDRAFT_759263 [Peniophora sp. CONT]|nr:hypothetical protein PENSPDRAFT_759263 [Peniophora sp. CONT]
MSTLHNTSFHSDVPPPAYHDGRAIERLPAYREGHLRRHHPYARYEPTLLQRLLLSPHAYEITHTPVPVSFAVNIGLHIGLEDSLAEGAAVNAGENSSAPIPPPSSGAQAGRSEGATVSHVTLNSGTQKPTTSIPRPTKRKRDDFEGEGDSE